MNDHSAGYVDLPRTAYLDHTIRRARTAAEQRSHRYVTLEHLLFALMDDPDAIKLIQSTGADLPLIKSAAADIVNNKMSSLAVPDGRAPSFSYKFDAIFAGASEDAMRLGRRDVDGGLALIAIAKDRDSGAASILAANGFHAQPALQVFSPHAMGAPAQAQAPASVTPPPPPSLPVQYRPEPQAQAAVFQPTPSAASSNSMMEDMLTSVRNILDAEERRERGLPPAPPAPPAPPPPPSLAPVPSWQ